MFIVKVMLGSEPWKLDFSRALLTSTLAD